MDPCKENRDSPSKPRGKPSKATSAKKSFQNAHTNLAYSEDDDFVTANIDSNAIPLREERVQKLPKEKMSDKKMLSKEKSIPQEQAALKLDTMEQGKLHSTGRKLPGIYSVQPPVTDENFQVKVVDPHLSNKLQTVYVTESSHTTTVTPSLAQNDDNANNTPTPNPFMMKSVHDVVMQEAMKRKPLLASRLVPTATDDADGKHSNSLGISSMQNMKMTAASRTQSEQGDKKVKKSWKLLRDLSFSDANAKTIQDYGALKNAATLPERTDFVKPKEIIDDEDEDYEEELLPETMPEVVMTPLMKLMKELISRGKVNEIAVMGQDGHRMVASCPSLSMSKAGVCGLVKAVMGKQQMLKLLIDGEMYSCFKHSSNKLLARSGDQLIVAQRTVAVVVVAQSLDDTPGSCLYEVAEFADVLEDKGW